MGIENGFDQSFVARLTSQEKQIQQNYRPVIGVHKWFARRPGSLFRSLLLSEFADRPLRTSYYEAHDFRGKTVADPFMGGGSSLFEANRVGCNVLGFDINSMAFWIVRQELAAIDRKGFRDAAVEVADAVRERSQELYLTSCVQCRQLADVKYFLWVKQEKCENCGDDVDLFPGYLVAEDIRHPLNVFYCPECDKLVELAHRKGSVSCPTCNFEFSRSASRGRFVCKCGQEGKYPSGKKPPKHRLFAMEYHCNNCRGDHNGRFFKTPDSADVKRAKKAKSLLSSVEQFIPAEEIPDGDETKRLHRWGYLKYRDMFNERQLFTLGLLSEQIGKVTNAEARHALATVMSDSLRYQNMLCRYDTYALKCQDIFAVHGFPVGLIQCENNVIGIPKIGTGGFRHFVEKYDRAKAYCEQPFETIKNGSRKQLVAIPSERIEAKFVRSSKLAHGGRRAYIRASSIDHHDLETASLDAVFTDPPYFDNVQYAELMDFCYVWLKRLLHDVPEFVESSTRSHYELTGNATTGKGLAHFTEGLSKVYTTAANALKEGAPFAFTYHHNDVSAYAPIVVAVLNAGLRCTDAIPCPAEMSASLHINGTSSSVLDTIFVCRKDASISKAAITRRRLSLWLTKQIKNLQKGGVRCQIGDVTCMAFGWLSRETINQLLSRWNSSEEIVEQLNVVIERLKQLLDSTDCLKVARESIESACEISQARLFD